MTLSELDASENFALHVRVFFFFQFSVNEFIFSQVCSLEALCYLVPVHFPRRFANPVDAVAMSRELL